jgi:hypothetical protein
MKRELIYTSKGKQTDFQKQVNFVMFKSNDLIRIFNENQPFEKIKARDEAESLILGNIEFFDSIILQSIKLPKNNLEINVLKLCELYSIPRGEFCRLIGLSPDHVSGCATCNTSKTVKLKGENIISFDQYNSYSEFLTWGNGFFDLNNSAIEKHKETFCIYIENKNQSEYYNHFVNLAKVLNSHIELAKLGNEQINNLSKITGLQILDNKLVLNNMKLSETIKYMK